MSSIEGKRLSEFSTAVRESTLKRLHEVPEGYENWRLSPESMSFADVAQHLINADNWLFKKLDIENLDPMRGKAGLVNIADRKEYVVLLDQLRETGRHRAGMLANLTESRLSEMIPDARFGSETSIWWIIVRGNLDHEIHHRGQIAAYLRIINTANTRSSAE